MIIALIILAVIVALTLLVTYIRTNPAMIHVIFESGTRVEWPLWLFTVRAVEVIIVLLIVIKIVWTIFRLPAISKRFGKKRRASQAGQLLQKGMLAMGKGKWRQAERLLAKGARISQAANQDASLFLSAAAQAAQHQGAEQRRDQYLIEARQLAVDGKDTFTAAVAEAELHLESNEPQQALAALQPHHTTHFDNERLLMAKSQAYEQLGQYDKVWHLLKNMKKYFPNKEAFIKRQEAVAQSLFNHMDSKLDDIERIWSELPRTSKNNEHLILDYSSALINCGEKSKAEALLIKEIRNSYSDVLIHAYSQLDAGSSRQRLSNYVSWLNARPDNAFLNYGAAKAAFQSEELEKAKTYAERAVKIEPLPEALALLGQIYEALGESHNALQAYRTSVNLTYKASDAVSGEVLVASEGANLLTDASEKDSTLSEPSADKAAEKPTK